MRNTWLVIKHEISSRLGKPSFWLTTFVFPMIIMGITFGSQLLANNIAADEQQSLMELLAGQLEDQPVSGYVDRAGLVEQFPETFPRELFQAYADEATAKGTFLPFEALTDQSLMEYLLTYNLTGDQRTTQLLYNPALEIERTALAPQETTEQRPDPGAADGAGTAVSYGVLFIFFFLVTMSSGFMLNSVTKEKEDNVVEVLLLSLQPRDLMLGKILGLGVVGLLQMVIWGGAAFALTGSGLTISALAVLSNVSLPPMFIVWGLLYFLLGYLTFASALGAIGALAPNTREGSQFTFVVLLPLMIPLWLNTAFTEAPNGTLAVILSLFPLSSPAAMMARLAATTVPLWQILVSLGLLAGTTYGFVLLAARLFRADTLLSGAALNAKRLIRNVREAMLGS